MSEEFEELEEQLRAAHEFIPRPGFQEEIRTQLRPGRTLPWPGLSAAAAVLLAVVGAGLLLHSAPHGGGAATGANGAVRGPQEVATFGRLPTPAFQQALSGASASSSGRTPAPVPNSAYLGLPATASVYRWVDTTAECSEPGNPTLDGYPVLGPVGCHLAAPLERATYQLAPPPSGASLVYVSVPDGAIGYFEPAYRLPGGSLLTALAPDELRG